MLAHLTRDIRYAVRQLAGAPAFTAVAIATLALGIGASTAIFSVVNGVLLRPLPYADPETLVRVFEIVPQYGRFAVAPANFLDWRQQNTVFERIGAYLPGSVTYAGREGPERIEGAFVSWDLFQLLGVAPAFGRSFRPEEDGPGGTRVVVLSHALWERRFGGDPAVLGRAATFSGLSATIVGVMPPGFGFPSREAEFWAPLRLDPADAARGGHFLSVIARTRDGVTLEQAGAAMKTIAARLALQYPETNAGESVEVLTLHDQVVGPIRPALLTLLAAVGVVILIACANVANLLLVRASVRAKEVAVRAALGAGRRRIVLQMLVESLVLACAGGTLGLALAYAAIRPIQTLSAGRIPRVDDVSIDGGVLVFAVLVSALTAMLFGLAPAWHASRGGFGEVLKQGGRSASAAGGRAMRSALLVSQVALSMVLLIGAALLLRSFARLTDIDPGFDADRVLAFQIALPSPSYPDDPDRLAFYERFLERLDAHPAVSAAGLVQTLPIRSDYRLSVAIQGRPAPKPGEQLSANHRMVSAGYFRTLGIPLLRGRTFTERDTATSPLVAVVDEAFAKRHFPDEDPIGARLDLGNGADGFYEIVGLVGSVHHEGLDANPWPTMYVPFAQDDVFSTMWIVARSERDPALLAGAARQALGELDPGLPAFSMMPLTDVVSDSVARRRFSMLLLALFAFVALFLAAVGLYGVVAYSVAQRTQEIGVRTAMGARRGQILGMILGGGMKLALTGVVIGLAGALAVSRLVEAMLFEVTALDPASYLATALVFLAVAALACYAPARRAMRVDPVVALRQT